MNAHNENGYQRRWMHEEALWSLAFHFRCSQRGKVCYCQAPSTSSLGAFEQDFPFPNVLMLSISICTLVAGISATPFLHSHQFHHLRINFFAVSMNFAWRCRKYPIAVAPRSLSWRNCKWVLMLHCMFGRLKYWIFWSIASNIILGWQSVLRPWQCLQSAALLSHQRERKHKRKRAL